jgi:HSP20 family protein
MSGRGIHMDMKETAEQYEIIADLPGVSKEQTKVEVKDHVLTISYERKFEEKAEGETYHRLERFQGTASRSIRLPRNVDENQVEAKFTNGVLSVSIKKLPEAQPKSIAIN